MQNLKCLKPVDSGSWEEQFGITAHQSSLLVFPLTVEQGGTNYTKVIAFYHSTDAITEADYDSLPVGSIIFDLQAKKIHMIDATSAVVSSAAMT